MLGLSIGIIDEMIITLIIQYDFSFDQYEPGKDRIYRVISEGNGWKNAGVPVPLHVAIQNNTTGIEKWAALFQYNDWNTKVSIPQSKNFLLRFLKSRCFFTDSNYFSIFPHRWLGAMLLFLKKSI